MRLFSSRLCLNHSNINSSIRSVKDNNLILPSINSHFTNKRLDIHPRALHPLKDILHSSRLVNQAYKRDNTRKTLTSDFTLQHHRMLQDSNLVMAAHIHHKAFLLQYSQLVPVLLSTSSQAEFKRQAKRSDANRAQLVSLRILPVMHTMPPVVQCFKARSDQTVSTH